MRYSLMGKMRLSFKAGLTVYYIRMTHDLVSCMALHDIRRILCAVNSNRLTDIFINIGVLRNQFMKIIPKFKQWVSTIPPISTKRTITSQFEWWKHERVLNFYSCSFEYYFIVFNLWSSLYFVMYLPIFPFNLK